MLTQRRTTGTPPRSRHLEFFNGFGGFAEAGREYVTILRGWAVDAGALDQCHRQPDFGFQVSAEGSGFTWSLNSQQNQLTPWSNDPVSDPPGEAIYLRDEDSGEFWGPTALPIREDGSRLYRAARPGLQPVRA